LTHLFVIAPDRPASLTALSRETGVPLSTLQREVDVLERAGIVRSARIGPTRLVTANEKSPYHDDLESLLMKAAAPVPWFRDALAKVAGVTRAFIFGSWARRYGGADGPPPNDIDLLVVGEVSPNAIYAVARDAEEVFGVDVNPLVVSAEEWDAPEGLVRRVKDGALIDVFRAEAA